MEMTTTARTALAIALAILIVLSIVAVFAMKRMARAREVAA